MLNDTCQDTLDEQPKPGLAQVQTCAPIRTPQKFPIVVTGVLNVINRFQLRRHFSVGLAIGELVRKAPCDFSICVAADIVFCRNSDISLSFPVGVVDGALGDWARESESEEREKRDCDLHCCCGESIIT